MWLSGHDRLAYLVLSDKRLSVYEVQRDDALIEKINLAIDTMAHAIETSTPPPLDAEIAFCAPVEPASDSGAVPADLTELARRSRPVRRSEAVRGAQERG